MGTGGPERPRPSRFVGAHAQQLFRILRFHTAEPRRASSHFGLSGFTGRVPDPPFLLPSSPARNRFVFSFISPIASASISRSISPHLLLSAQFNTPLTPPPHTTSPSSPFHPLGACPWLSGFNPSSPYPPTAPPHPPYPPAPLSTFYTLSLFNPSPRSIHRSSPTPPPTGIAGRSVFRSQLALSAGHIVFCKVNGNCLAHFSFLIFLSDSGSSNPIRTRGGGKTRNERIDHYKKKKCSAVTACLMPTIMFFCFKNALTVKFG